MTATIQIKRDTAANWTAANRVLAAGEQGRDTTTNKTKTGDGVTAWNSLAFDAGGTFTGGTLTTALNEAPIVTIASSATPAIGAALANTINLSGAVTVTGFDTIAAGAKRTIRHTGAHLLTHNATSLILLTGANITTVAGDVSDWISLGAGNWAMTSYVRASGAALVGAAGSLTRRDVAGTTDTLVVGDNANFVDYTSASAIAVSITTAFNGLSTQLTWPTSAGTITLTPTGVTLNGSASALVLSQAGGSIAILASGTNAFRVFGSVGDLVAADVTDSTTAGRALLTAADLAAQLAILTLPTGTTVSASRALATTDINKITRVDTAGGAVVLTLNSATITPGQRAFFQRNGANALNIVTGTATISNPDTITIADGAVVGLIGDLRTSGNGVLV